MALPSWPHSRDTLTVWKRHTFCAIHYGDDSEDDGSDSSDGEPEIPNDDNDTVGDGESPKGRSAALGSATGVFASASGSSSLVDERAGEPRQARDGHVSDDEEDNSDGSPLFDSDDMGSVEGLPIGVPDVDMYAFIPEDEQMSCARAAPFVRFLLDT